MFFFSPIFFVIKKVMEIVGSCSANNFVLQLSSIYKYCLLTFHLVRLSFSLLLLRNYTRIIFRMKEVNFLDINTGSNHFKKELMYKNALRAIPGKYVWGGVAVDIFLDGLWYLGENLFLWVVVLWENILAWVVVFSVSNK